MAADQLSDGLKRRGAQVLADLDSAGLNPQGLLWLHFPHLKDWRLTVITDLVDTVGRKKAYDLVGSIVDRDGSIEGLTLFDLHLAAPSEILPRVLGGAMFVDNGVAELSECNIDGIPVDAVIYRLRRERPAAEAKKAAKALVRVLARQAA